MATYIMIWMVAVLCVYLYAVLDHYYYKKNVKQKMYNCRQEMTEKMHNCRQEMSEKMNQVIDAITEDD